MAHVNPGFRPEGVRVDAADWFADPDFWAYVRNRGNCVATWHEPHLDEPGEYSDIFVLIDHGESNDSRLPHFEELVALVGDDRYVLVQITNLD